MGPRCLRIILIPALDDPPPGSREYQEVLRDFEQALRANGFTPAVQIRTLDAAAGLSPSTYTGVFELVERALPVLALLLGGWLQSRATRKVRLKFDDVEAEAQTVKEVKKLLKLATRQRKKSL